MATPAPNKGNLLPSEKLTNGTCTVIVAATRPIRDGSGDHWAVASCKTCGWGSTLIPGFEKAKQSALGHLHGKK